ncbi:DNA mismatch repair protein MSH [Acrasis kona]|uniref:DNA mismatch repair protein MSH n=1 Tax=Acrasis kona TaxID=1008807 RepID=A0AAW2YZ08_9EUKA
MSEKKQTSLFSYKRKPHNPHINFDEEEPIESDNEEEEEEEDAEVEEEEDEPKAKKSRFAGARKKRHDKDEPRFEWLIKLKDENGVAEGMPGYDPSTLYVPSSAYTNMTPFEKQYWDIKKKNWDSIGKFYELYENDADVGKKEFDLKMTDRVNMRMVGVPESSFPVWASKFIALGYKIARVEQMETPNDVKKRKIGAKTPRGSTENVVNRELQQILTAGTLVDPSMITDSNMNNYLLCVKEDILRNNFGICYVDTSTGELNLGCIQDDPSRASFETLFQQILPKEILFERGGLSKQTLFIIRNGKTATMSPRKPITEFWDSDTTVRELNSNRYFEQVPPVVEQHLQNDLVMCAFGALLSYLRDLKLDDEIMSLGNFRNYDPNSDTSTMVLDGQTLLNLEILQNNRDGSKSGSLLEFLDFCISALGRRMFRHWICHPLKSPPIIKQRQQAVTQLEQHQELVDQIRTLLKTIPDLERFLSRIHAEARSKKDFIQYDPHVSKKRIKLLLDSLQGLDTANQIIVLLAQQIESGDLTCTLLIQLVNDTPDIDPIVQKFNQMFNHAEARSTGNIIPAPGANPQYDECTKNISELESTLNAFLAECAKKVKLPVSKVNFKHIQKQLYQVEVPHQTKVPDDWAMITQTKTTKRYYPNGLVKLIDQRALLEEEKENLLRNEVKRVFIEFDEFYSSWIKVAVKVAELDCLISLSMVGTQNGLSMCWPTFVQDKCLDVDDLIHPCVQPPEGSFVPNDTRMGVIENGEVHANLIVVTGANMGGKSTVLRQNCVAVILAQLGCRIPASRCVMSPVDRIFTRIGANDRIMSGESTFMVELNETSNILRNATGNSLIILDELGRGTSTFDGYAIAYAVARYLAEVVKCRTLFSTHYFHLTEDLHSNPFVSLYQMAVNENSDTFDVTFLYRFVQGVSPKSYGLSVAKKAGIPMSVIENAKNVAKNFEDVLRIGGGTGNIGGKNVFTTQQRNFFLELYKSICTNAKDYESLRQNVLKLYEIYK